MSRLRASKVTIVGLRSVTNLFEEKRLMWNSKYGGKGCSSLYRLRWLRCSCDLMPSYFDRIDVSGT